jgi:hypothetical protein
MISFAIYGISGIAAGSTLIYSVGKYIKERRWKKKNDVKLQDVYQDNNGSPRYRRDHIGLPIDESYSFNSEEA